MQINRRSVGFLTLLALALGMSFMLSGCKKSDDAPPAPPQVAKPSRPPDRIELMPENSGEVTRRHVHDDWGNEVETHIDYKNGDKAITKQRPNGSKAEYQRQSSDGKLMVQHKFADDGVTVVSGQELRDDGTIKTKYDQLPNGAIQTTVFWYDGKRQFSVSTKQADGSIETKMFRKNGALWATRGTDAAGKSVSENTYSRDGKLELTQTRTGATLVVTQYRADGTARMRQTFTERKNSWGSTDKSLSFVEELATDGKTVERKLISDTYGYDITEVHRSNADGTTTIRKVRSGGSVYRQEVRDASGTLISDQDFDYSSNESEDIPYGIRWTPYQADPTQTWDYQERYPYMRDQDP